jgi:hypothetical protein
MQGHRQESQCVAHVSSFPLLSCLPFAPSNPLVHFHLALQGLDEDLVRPLVAVVRPWDGPIGWRSLGNDA